MEEDCPYPVVIIGGTVAFALVNKLSGHLAPSSQTPQQEWKWRNVFTSLIHSIITGLWAVSVFYKAPYLTDDLHRQYSYSSHTLVSFSIGYFIYDALDMIINHRKRSTYELLLHHGLVILCYSVAVISRQFVSFVSLSLIVELNSVFLHTRQLLIITSQPRESLGYRVNSLLNIITFLIFRICLLSWLTHWMASQREHIALGFLLVAFIGLGIIDVMNVILFGRILYVDVEVFKICSKSKSVDENGVISCSNYQEEEGVEEDSVNQNTTISNNQNHINNGNGIHRRSQTSVD